MVKKLLLVSAVVAAMTGCTGSNIYSSDTYTASQAKQVQSVSYGTIMAARPVKVQGESDGLLGTVGGAVIGGFLGNTIGDGSGQALATAAGAVLGAAVGQGIGNQMSEYNGVELEIKQDNGNIIAVVQTIKNTQFVVGQRVRLVGHSDNLTVSPL